MTGDHPIYEIHDLWPLKGYANTQPPTLGPSQAGANCMCRDCKWFDICLWAPRVPTHEVTNRCQA